MARPRLELGTWGKVTRSEISPGKHRARARFRDFTGRTKQVEAYGKSGAEAERRLLKTLRDRVQSAGDTISGNTTVSALGKIWTARLERSDLSSQTIGQYKDHLHRFIEPALGEVLLVEVTVSRVDGFLRTLAHKTPSAARMSKVVLSHMFTLAVQHDALRTSPVREVRLPKTQRKPVQALSVDEVTVLRKALRAWVDDPAGHKRSVDIPDAVDLMLATGMRIGEVLALRWSEVDLGEQPTVTVSGTLTYTRGEGLRRQPRTKTDAGHRIIPLPAFAVDVLLRRSVDAVPTEPNAVFTSGRGTFLWPNNVRRTLRSALEHVEALHGVSPHTLRKSVATLIDAEATLEQAAAVLGHSGTQVTSKHYIAKAAQAPDVTEILNRFGQDSEQKDG